MKHLTLLLTALTLSLLRLFSRQKIPNLRKQNKPFNPVMFT